MAGIVSKQRVRFHLNWDDEDKRTLRGIERRKKRAERRRRRKMDRVAERNHVAQQTLAILQDERCHEAIVELATRRFHLRNTLMAVLSQLACLEPTLRERLSAVANEGHIRLTEDEEEGLVFIGGHMDFQRLFSNRLVDRPDANANNDGDLSSLSSSDSSSVGESGANANEEGESGANANEGETGEGESGANANEGETEEGESGANANEGETEEGESGGGASNEDGSARSGESSVFGGQDADAIINLAHLNRNADNGPADVSDGEGSRGLGL